MIRGKRKDQGQENSPKAGEKIVARLGKAWSLWEITDANRVA